MPIRRIVALSTILVAVVLAGGCSDSEDTVAPPTGEAPCVDRTDPGFDLRFHECVDPDDDNYTENGTVTDTNTGLIWLKAADCFERQNYADALSAVADLAEGECGLTDGSSRGAWRLPTKAEWEAMIRTDCDFGDPHIPNADGEGCWKENDAFTGVRPSSYWSRTSESPPGFKSVVFLHDGHFTPGNSDSLNHVWPVR